MKESGQVVHLPNLANHCPPSTVDIDSVVFAVATRVSQRGHSAKGSDATNLARENPYKNEVTTSDSTTRWETATPFLVIP